MKIYYLKKPKYIFFLGFCCLCTMFFPFVYGPLLILLQNYNQEWLTVLIGWTGGGIDDWVEELIPAVRKTYVDLGFSQHGDFIPSIRHTYSVGALIFVLICVLLFGFTCIHIFSSSFWAKRAAILRLQGPGHSFFLLSVIGVILGPVSLYLVYYPSVVETVLESDIRRMRIFVAYFPDSLYIFILILWMGGALFIGGSFMMVCTGIKVRMLRRYRRINKTKREKRFT